MKKGVFLLWAFVLLTACQAQTQITPSPLPKVEVVEDVIPDMEDSAPAESETADPLMNYNEYTVNLDVNPETGVIKGSQNVVYLNRSDDVLDKICFNIPLNAFSAESSYIPYFGEFRDKIFEEGREYASMSVESVVYNGTNAAFGVSDTVLTVYIDGLEPGFAAEIAMQFQAYIPDINHRFGANEDAVWCGGFLPSLAVYENGGFRTDPYYPAGDPFYSESANYSVNVVTPKSYNVVGTGSSSVVEDENSKTTAFTALMVRDFTFAVINRHYKELGLTTQNGVDISIHYRSSLPDGDKLIKQAENAVNFYESYAGGYPYGKIDIVETGLFLEGGMEFSQVIFIDGDKITAPDAANTLLHEIGHQWFYNIVGTDQINTPWMDEALVSLLQEKASAADISQFTALLESDYNRLNNRLSDFDSLKLSDTVAGYKNWANYYNIQYIKGRLMLYSLNMKMGEEKFSEFIKTYYTDYSFKIARQEDFIKTAEDVYRENLRSFFNTWLSGEELPPLYS